MTTVALGMACYDEAENVWFTIQALRWFMPGQFDQLIVVDNNPKSKHGEAVKGLIATKLARVEVPCTYVPFDAFHSTAVRNEVFAASTCDWTVCIDSHVFLAPTTGDTIRTYARANPDSKDLLQGPMAHDALEDQYTHFTDRWRSGMRGTWGRDARGRDPSGDPFDIPMQGLGMFACRTAAWAGFNPLFRGFGGEEGYIHTKVRQRGGRTLCHPALLWLHKFIRPAGQTYPSDYQNRIRNYVLGHLELGEPLDGLHLHFVRAKRRITQPDFDRLVLSCERELRAAHLWTKHSAVRWNNPARNTPKVVNRLETC